MVIASIVAAAEAIFGWGINRMTTDESRIIAIAIAAVVLVFALMGCFRLEGIRRGRRHRSPDENAPYVGEWEGRIYWEDFWAKHMFHFCPNHTRAVGEISIYRSANGTYKALGLWQLWNDDHEYAVAATRIYDFRFRLTGRLKSFSFKAEARRTLIEGTYYGPSPTYIFHFTDEEPNRLSGTIRTSLPADFRTSKASLDENTFERKLTLVGIVTFERR
jgi:hypothetical protein